MGAYGQVITKEAQRLWGSDTGAYIAVIRAHFRLGLQSGRRALSWGLDAD
jgi:hypothetical protein